MINSGLNFCDTSAALRLESSGGSNLHKAKASSKLPDATLFCLAKQRYPLLSSQEYTFAPFAFVITARVSKLGNRWNAMDSESDTSSSRDPITSIASIAFLENPFTVRSRTSGFLKETELVSAQMRKPELVSSSNYFGVGGVGALVLMEFCCDFDEALEDCVVLCEGGKLA
nr:hypothetical protein Iba_chr02aCG6930 [Ipomoea batatas]